MTAETKTLRVSFPLGGRVPVASGMRQAVLEPSEPRTPLGVGMMWASRVTTLGLEFALPAWGGYWLDSKLGSAPWGVLLGAILGFTVGIMHLLRIARTGSPN